MKGLFKELKKIILELIIIAIAMGIFFIFWKAWSKKASKEMTDIIINNSQITTSQTVVSETTVSDNETSGKEKEGETNAVSEEQ